MTLSGRILFPLAAVLGAGAVILPSVALSETTPTIEALNIPGGAYEHHAWSPATATVGEGGSIVIANNTLVRHGVKWVSDPSTPSCSSGVPVGSTAAASAANWSGTCTFSKPGTYTFECTVHPEMKGTITVSPNGTTTISAGNGTTTSAQAPAPGGGPVASTPTGPPVPVSQTSGPAGRGAILAANAVRIASSQRGAAVRGSVLIAPSAAGARLEVELLAHGAALAQAGRSPLVNVGQTVRSSLRPGRVAFSVALSARARRALARRGRLQLLVRLIARVPDGASQTLTRNVLLRA